MTALVTSGARTHRVTRRCQWSTKAWTHRCLPTEFGWIAPLRLPSRRSVWTWPATVALSLPWSTFCAAWAKTPERTYVYIRLCYSLIVTLYFFLVSFGASVQPLRTLFGSLSPCHVWVDPSIVYTKSRYPSWLHIIVVQVDTIKYTNYRYPSWLHIIVVQVDTIKFVVKLDRFYQYLVAVPAFGPAPGQQSGAQSTNSHPAKGRSPVLIHCPSGPHESICALARRVAIRGSPPAAFGGSWFRV